MWIPLWKGLSKYSKKGSFVHNVLILASGTIVGKAIAILASPLLTRIYLPEDFGILSVFVAVISIGTLLGTWRYELAIPLPEDDLVSANLTIGAIIILLISTFIITVLIIVLKPIFINWFGILLYKSFLWLLPISVFGTGVYNILAYWAIRHNFFKELALTKFSRTCWQIITQLLLGYTYRAGLGLILGDVVGRFAGNGILVKIAYKKYYKIFHRTSWRGIIQALHCYKGFPLFTTWASFFHISGQVVYPILLSAFYGAKVAGWFSLAQQTVGVTLTLIGQAVAEAFFAKASCLARDNLRELQMFFIKTSHRLILIGFIPLCIISVFAPRLFVVVFGQGWGEAGIYIRLLSSGVFVQFVVGPVFPTLFVLCEQKQQLKCDIIGFIVIIGGVYVVNLFCLTARLAIFIYSLGISFTYIGLWLITFKSIKKHIKHNG